MFHKSTIYTSAQKLIVLFRKVIGKPKIKFSQISIFSEGYYLHPVKRKSKTTDVLRISFIG